jgi:hypothetical protein
MNKIIQGLLMAATPESTATFMWTDPTSQQQKPIKSIRVLLAHGDGTVTRESISLPPNTDFPQLTIGSPMLFPVTVSINKKKQLINYTLRTDLPPMPAPSLG